MIWPYLDLSQLRSILNPQSYESRPPIVDPVFVCIDTEFIGPSWDALTEPTEIGVAVLDTKALASLKEDVTPSSLIELTSFAMYRIGKKDTVFRFGRSRRIRKASISSVLARIFRDPTKLRHATGLFASIPDAKRNIILAGHALHHDVSIIKHQGFHPFNVVAALDTQMIIRESQERSVALESLLQMLDVKTRNLHNAGNDAAYTLVAIIKLGLASNTSLTRFKSLLTLWSQSKKPKSRLNRITMLANLIKKDEAS